MNFHTEKTIINYTFYRTDKTQSCKFAINTSSSTKYIHVYKSKKSNVFSELESVSAKTHSIFC